MGRPRKADIAVSLKSSPTTATRFTGAKKEAATAKNDALPPSTFSAVPNGVSTVSYATLPTTRIDMPVLSSACTPEGCALRLSVGGRHVPADDGGQIALDLRGHQVRGRDQGVLQRARALAGSRRQARDPA